MKDAKFCQYPVFVASFNCPMNSLTYVFPIFLSWQVMAIQRAMKRLQNIEVKFVDHKQIEEWGKSWMTGEGNPLKCA